MAVEETDPPTVSGLSGHGRADLTRVLGRGRRLITVEDAARALELDHVEAAKRLAGWARRGWLRRARQGLYLPVPVDAERPGEWTEDPFYLAAAIWAPAFVTGWTAANHWGLTDQIFRTTVVKTGQRVRSTLAAAAGHEFMLIHAGPNEFGWGTKNEWRADLAVQVADPARTTVDIAARPVIGGGIRLFAEVLEAYLTSHDPLTLIDYGERIGNRAVFKRLGYLVEVLELQQPKLVDACRHRVAKGYVLLDPSAPPSGPRVARWGLRANVNLDRSA